MRRPWFSSVAGSLILTQLLFPLLAQAQPLPPPDLSRARQQGYSDALSDGEREGRDRGRADGEQSGRTRGYREGYAQCLRDRKQQAYDQGYFSGNQQGAVEGANEGQIRGYQEGRINGEDAGRHEGELRAERSGRSDSELPGRTQGTAEADRTDSLSQGAAAGAVSGDSRAKETAEKKDFPAGRESYRASRFAEPILSDKLEDLTDASIFRASDLKQLSSLEETGSQWQPLAFPDFRYRNERPPFSEPEMRRAYSDGYREGYAAGFQRTYQSEFNYAENAVLSQARQQGARAIHLIPANATGAIASSRLYRLWGHG